MLQRRSLLAVFLATGLTACLAFSGCGPSAKNQALALLESGSAKALEGAYDEAIRDYTQATELKRDFAEAYRNRGAAYHGKGEYDSAIRYFTKVIELEPGDAEAYHRRGVSYGSKRERELAIRDYTKAIELEPDYVKAYYNRGLAYGQLGQWDSAIRDCTKAIELKPDFLEAYRTRGHAYCVLGQWDSAIRDYTKAIELEPGDAEAYSFRACAYYEKGLDAAARFTYYPETLELEGELGATIWSGSGSVTSPYHRTMEGDLGAVIGVLAWAYGNQEVSSDSKGEYDSAIRDWTTAIELKPDYAEAYGGRAMVHYELKAYDKAWADVKRCRELGLAPDPALIGKLTKDSGRSE